MKKLKNIILVIATLIVVFFCWAIFSDDDEDSENHNQKTEWDSDSDDEDYEFEDNYDEDYYYEDETEQVYEDKDLDSGESTNINNLSKDEQEKLFRELYYQHYGFYPGENNLEYEEEEFVSKPTSSTTTKVQDKNSQNASDWTVLIYMCGSDLESQYGDASSDLQTILGSKIGDNVNVVIQTGGAKTWKSNGISSKKLERWIVKNGKLQKVEELKLASMGNPGTLKDFVNWGCKKYPAKKYILDFWNHGSGSVYGVCFDELFKDKETGDLDSLKVSELKAATNGFDEKFELFLFDTCLSATVEIADIMSHHGNYMVASEEIIYGGCAGYEVWLSQISKNPTITGKEIGESICKYFKKKMTSYGYASTHTISSIDLSKIPAVKEAFVAMASKMNSVTNDVTAIKTLRTNGAKAIKYGSASNSEGYSNLVDLGDLADKSKSVTPKESQKLISAIKDAVIYESHGSSKSASNGISVYYPVKYVGDTTHYSQGTDNRPYLQYLDAILDKWTAPEWVYQNGHARKVQAVSSKNFEVKYKVSVKEDKEGAHFTLNITNGLESIQSVGFNLFWYDEDTKEYLYLGKDNTIICDYDKGEFSDDFQATWMTIGDDYVNAELIDEDDDYNYYSIPIELNGKETNLRINYNFKSEKYEILGAYDGLEGNASSKGMRKLKDGDKIKFQYWALKEDADEDDEDAYNFYYSDEIRYSKKNFKMEDSDLNPGLYMYQYEIIDIFGNVYTSDFAEMEYTEDGELTVAYDEED